MKKVKRSDSLKIRKNLIRQYIKFFQYNRKLIQNRLNENDFNILTKKFYSIKSKEKRKIFNSTLDHLTYSRSYEQFFKNGDYDLDDFWCYFVLPYDIHKFKWIDRIYKNKDNHQSYFLYLKVDISMRSYYYEKEEFQEIVHIDKNNNIRKYKRCEVQLFETCET